MYGIIMPEPTAGSKGNTKENRKGDKQEKR